MLRKLHLVLVASTFCLFSLSASATLMVGLDLDTSTAGIENTLTVTEGDSVNIGFYLFDDAVIPPPISLINFDILYSSVFSSTLPGAVAAIGATGLFDLGAIVPTPAISGNSLTPLPVPPFPNSLGQYGLGAFAGPFFSPSVASIFATFSFNADIVGQHIFSFNLATTGIVAAGLGPLPNLFANNNQFVLNVNSAVVTPPPTGVPEPESLALICLGLAGMFYTKKKSRR